MVVNIHEREFPVAPAAVAELVASLSSADDRLWPVGAWPRMRLHPGLVPGARGGHGPVRYRVERVDAGEVVFRFTGPAGFDGWHGYSVQRLDNSTTILRHELRMRVHGWARVTWPTSFRPLHDALIEESLDKAARELGCPCTPYRRPPWTRLAYRLAEAAGVQRPRTAAV
ncbi:MAG: SRPBCC family protein [Gordonia sp. (in: high G+C Gram-positive bacteria)]|uniref:SRPBCC family protein n=1 Tax=Gordonia sp. (in: high G+C Gram-positive bacteria) TaxID=84139 RepID=UPI0039E6610E